MAPEMMRIGFPFKLESKPHVEGARKVWSHSHTEIHPHLQPNLSSSHPLQSIHRLLEDPVPLKSGQGETEPENNQGEVVLVGEEAPFVSVPMPKHLPGQRKIASLSI